MIDVPERCGVAPLRRGLGVSRVGPYVVQNRVLLWKPRDVAVGEEEVAPFAVNLRGRFRLLGRCKRRFCPVALSDRSP